MSQYERIKEKVIRQASLIASRFKPKKNYDHLVTNQDIRLLMSAYSVSGRTYLTEAKIEDLHERLSRLDEEEMNIIRLFFWEGKTQEEIGVIIGKNRRTVGKRIEKAIEKMR